MEAALQLLVPKIRPDLDFQVHAFQGISDMLDKLPARFRGYAAWLGEDQRVVVVRDEDRKDCVTLKAQIETMARNAGLAPKAPGKASFQVLTRIAVEELEAWLLGDVPALVATYPGVPLTLGHQRRYRDPDAITGGTWEALEAALQKAGHFLGGLPKIQVAREVAANMDPARNASRSFQVFRDGLRAL
ncbi:hypothetical protein BE17_53440 [Sorangium cellulosum]|uniref:DUF4276 family protein n=1 Tax=Sorangium cellulosum TaxID=56 RepID=A0A150SNQ6_SORCE|nr:hypothetical protein BE17_53440 [Sorangium cellulosum]